MSRGAPLPLAAVAALSFACAARVSGGAGSPVRLETPAARWEPAGPFNLELGVYNASGRTISIARPTPRALEVAVYPAGDGARPLCRTPTAPVETLEPWGAGLLEAGERRTTTVDLWPFCKGLREGEYRYEARFVANAARGAEALWTGRVGPEGGTIAIAPRSPPPGSGSEPASAAEPGMAGEGIRSCVDRELARRGLNAYGDPPETSYPGGAPVQEEGRVLYVASRHPEIREICGIKAF
jgi:hypothetical protein